jgi:hypothetical protein
MGACQWVLCLFVKDVQTLTFVLTLASLPYRDLAIFTPFFLNFGNRNPPKSLHFLIKNLDFFKKNEKLANKVKKVASLTS